MQDNQEQEVDEEQLRTLWCGGINDRCNEELLYELFQNAGPLERVTIPTDRETKKPKNFSFIVYDHPESVRFAYDMFNGVELFGSRVKLQNKAIGLGMDQGRGPPGGRGPYGGMHQRSFSTPSLPNFGRGGGGAQRWCGQESEQGRTAPNSPAYPPGPGYGPGAFRSPSFGNMPPMPPMYGQQQNGRERDYRGERQWQGQQQHGVGGGGRDERDRSRDGRGSYRERDRSFEGSGQRHRRY